MSLRSYRSGERWSIILAGGEGTRLSRLTIRRFGEHRPKQYCSFLGARTMFDHTMSRAIGFSGRERVVTVIGKGHMRFLTSPRPSALWGYVVEQPANHDTAPGLLLPLSYVLAHDADATVAVFPSDHYISPNEAFLECMDRAACAAESGGGPIVLVSAVADRPEVEYGWIQPGEPYRGARDVRVVRRFHEKPDADLAAAFHRDGYLWNSFNMAVKASTLWELGRLFEPALMERFERLRAAIGTPREGRVLGEVYEGMPTVNFSKSILEKAADRALVMPMRGVEWSDWGKPERIQETLDARAPSAAALFASAV